MKILGVNTFDKSVIAEISEDELANVMGFYARYQDGFKIKVGENMSMSELYKDAQAIKELKGEVKKFRQFFVKVADVMTKLKISMED
jgi:hypothetical protein